jgi:hypothetical protein
VCDSCFRVVDVFFSCDSKGVVVSHRGWIIVVVSFISWELFCVLCFGVGSEGFLKCSRLVLV